MVVIAHDNERGGKAGAEELEVLFGLESGEFPRKRQYLHAVYAGFGQQRLLLLQGRQEPKLPGILLQYRSGMRPECDHNGLLSPFTGSGDHCLKHMTVPQMDTVKKSGSDYSHFTHSKLWRCCRRAFLANTRAPTW